MTKSNYTHFRLSDDELRKMDIACEFYECNRTELLRLMIDIAYKRVARKEKKANGKAK